MKPRGLWWTFSTRKTPKTLHECAAGAGIKGCSTTNTVGVHRENEPQPHPCSAQFPPSSARNTAPVEPSLSRGSSWRSQEREDGKDRKTLWVENSQSRHLFLKKESTGHATSSPRVLSDLNSPLPNDQPLESSPSGEKKQRKNNNNNNNFFFFFSRAQGGCAAVRGHSWPADSIGVHLDYIKLNGPWPKVQQASTFCLALGHDMCYIQNSIPSSNKIRQLVPTWKVQ